jgi:two-component system, response regulator RegA
MTMDNRRLLLVDDRIDLRLTTAAILEDAGYEVVEAGSIAEARQVLDEKSLAAALVDVHLGDGSGLELVPVLRDRHPGAAVVLFTGSGANSELGGADALLSKGMKPEEMLERVAALIAARRA